MESKPWYTSKTIWGAIISTLLGVYQAVATGILPLGIDLPELPMDAIVAFLSFFGVYISWTRVTTNTVIK